MIHVLRKLGLAKSKIHLFEFDFIIITIIIKAIVILLNSVKIQ